MRRKYTAIILVLLAVCLVGAGTWTTNNYFYKPAIGETGYGTNVSTGFDRADAALALLSQVQSFYKLRVQNNAVTPASKIDITAQAVTVFDAGNNALILKNFSTTVNCGVTGANGLDTGALATNWYYFFVIAKSDGTTAGLASLSSTGPALPSGYTYKKLVSAVYYATSAFRLIYQKDKWANCSASNVLIHTVHSASWVSVSLATIIPVNSLTLKTSIIQDNDYDAAFYIAWDNTDAHNTTIILPRSSTDYGMGYRLATPPFTYDLNPSAPQTIYLKGMDGNYRGNLWCIAYELDL